jgi:hypothetical protein
MNRKDAGGVIVVVALIGLTTANLWERVAALKASTPPEISALQVGDRLPVLKATVLDPSGPARTPIELRRGICQLIVAFSPTCPYCKLAAAAEALLPDGAEIPTTWIMLHGNGAIGTGFRAELRAESALVFGDSAGLDLQVEVIPAGFLVGPDDLIRKVFVYRGDEPRQDLMEECRNTAGRSGS